jgi:hypothetical protein
VPETLPLIERHSRLDRSITRAPSRGKTSIDRGYVGRTHRLTSLAVDIVQAILVGTAHGRAMDETDACGKERCPTPFGLRGQKGRSIRGLGMFGAGKEKMGGPRKPLAFRPASSV